jgi:hypothetical protein
MIWTINNILNKGNKITWSYIASDKELVVEDNQNKYNLNEENRKLFNTYIDSLDIAVSDKEQLKQKNTYIPQRTHIVTDNRPKLDDLLNDVGQLFNEVCTPLNYLGEKQEADYVRYYKTPAELAAKIGELSDLRNNNGNKNGSVDPADYNSCCIVCGADADINQLLYVRAADNFKSAAKKIEELRYYESGDDSRIRGLKYLRKLFRRKLGTEGRRLCYYIDMDVVAECRKTEKKAILTSVLEGIELLMNDVYVEFDKWIAILINCEKEVKQIKDQEK